ncbi:MAG: DUF6270 domain-containing protein [Lachnospiraceae bacterium]|nr:DUF6270 domain-containing protein [Lachnospiraceae bacterium]
MADRLEVRITKDFEMIRDDGGFCVKQMKVAIWGSCISRDVFEFDTEHKLNLCEYISRTSIFSALSASAEQYFRKSDTITPWQLSCIERDLKKTHWINLKNADADYLLLDFIDERFMLYRIPKTSILMTASNELYDSHIVVEKELIKIDIDQFENTDILQYVDCFCKKLTEFIPPERIIINRGYSVTKYRTCNEEVESFDDLEIASIQKMNKRLETLYSCVINNIPKAKIINMPENILADEQHKWHLKPYHYEERFYQDVLGKMLEIYEEDI